MNSRRLRRRRSWAHFAAVGSLLVGAAPAVQASPDVVAVREAPSSISADFGPAVPLGTNGIAAVPTGSGLDFYDFGQAGGPLLGRFRTAGPAARAAAAGSTVFLFDGDRGVIAIDASDPAAPVARGSIGDLGDVALGAAAPVGGGVVAATDSTLHFLAWDPASGFSLRRTVTFTDGRRVRAVAARGDSFLVASRRSAPTLRLMLTLYRLRAGAAAPESLAEMAVNGHDPYDLAWREPLAFVADGAFGVLVIDRPARSIRDEEPVQSTKFVRSVDANDSVVVAAAEGRTVARFARTGAAGDSLAAETVWVPVGDPAHVRLVGDWITASTYEQVAPAEPDESGFSLLERVSLSGAPDPAPIGGSGRVRRVAVRDGLAYVADYTGGLRIYRNAPGDSSLVGTSPSVGNARPTDIAVDPVLPLVYMASGPVGLEIVRVGNPAAPVPVASVTVPGLASAVTVAGPNLVAVARRGISAGVTFVQIAFNPLDSSVVATVRGSVNAPFIQDPRALAARDTVLFVADDLLGVQSIGFGNPDRPEAIGSPSGSGARDLDLSGTLLLVATRSRGLQIVDVLNPVQPILRSELPTPPLLGVAQNGVSAVAFLGETGALVVDVSAPAAPFVRGPIAVPGTARDGWWSGDTLLVAASLGLERFLVSPGPVAVPVLDIVIDSRSALPRATISWAAVSRPGLVGLNLYRDLGTSSGADPAGRLVNRDLLPPAAVSVVDDSLGTGGLHRYRLEAFLADGSSVKVAEGSVVVSSAPLVGRVYPNPFRARGGSVASLSYRTPGIAPGAVLTLRVFDVAGRLVREMRTTPAGNTTFGVVTWDGRNAQGVAAPSGLYVLRLTGAGLDDSRAIVLVR
ncbi:MAG: FlgD immunoglobulin-like domain containing protein [Bacteroidota bacterium]